MSQEGRGTHKKHRPNLFHLLPNSTPFSSSLSLATSHPPIGRVRGGELWGWEVSWERMLVLGVWCQAKDQEGKDFLRLPSSLLSAGKDLKCYFIWASYITCRWTVTVTITFLYRHSSLLRHFTKGKKVLRQHWGNFLKNHSKVLHENHFHLSMKEYLIRSYIFFKPLSTNTNPFEKGNSQFNGYAYKKKSPSRK